LNRLTHTAKKASCRIERPANRTEEEEGRGLGLGLTPTLAYS